MRTTLQSEPRQLEIAIPRTVHRPSPTTIAVEIPEALAVELEALARRTGTPPQTLVRQAVAELIALRK